MQNLAANLQKIIKEGFLEKESRFLKSWRKRWFVLTPEVLYTFKERKVYDSPTEQMVLRDITSIKSCEEQTQKQFTFKIQTIERTYYMSATSNIEKEQWIGHIGKAMVKLNSEATED